MATVAVQMVLEKLGMLLSEEAQLLGGLRGGVDRLRDDLESMRSFLHDAESRSDRGEQGVNTWLKQVRDVAYDTDDVLAEFFMRLSPQPGHGFFHSLRKGFHYVIGLRTRHRLAVQINNINARVRAISERRNAFTFQKIDQSNAIESWHDPRMAALFIDESDVVGIEDPKNLLISWLVDGLQSLTTVSVVGMGGLGKTTLVKKTYDSHKVKMNFECRAWVTVSKSFTAVELLQAALKSFLESAKEPVPEDIGTMGHVQLVNELSNYLQHKRYVVVLDDVWGVNAWQEMKYAFPDCECKSRIIFTTRIMDVALAVDTHVHVYELQPLPENVAWTLFCAKAFRVEPRGVCPRELEVMSRSILKKCGGLPLAIVVIGGLLSRKNNLVSEWKKIHDRLGAEMKSNSNLQSIEIILLLSYKDLPYHLKCCYLYLSIFPEDYLIKRMKLIRLWTVERFVEEKAGFTTEEVAEDYLKELVSRSMIQVVHMDFSNRVVTCRVHDLIREIIQLKSMDESCVVILNERSLTLNEKVRRIALHDNCKDFPSAIKFPNLRSLLLFGSMGFSISSGSGIFCGFRWLRILELEGAELSRFPMELIGMIHLRYLSLRRTKIRELPESIGKLKSLEILDLKHSLIDTIPVGILHLKHLRQLRSYRYHIDSSTAPWAKSFGIRVPDGIGKLTHLEKLGSVEVGGNGRVLKELGNLTELRRLSILQMRQEDGIDLCSSLEKLKQLTTLYMEPIASDEVIPLDSLSSPPQFLQRLYLKCILPSLPEWIESLHHLVKLVLQYSNLSGDPLKTLRGLPNLVVLELREAYVGDELRCDARGGYPRLKKLFLYNLKELKCIRVTEGAMCGLRELDIMSCEKLEKVPEGIEHLRDLQELVIWGMPSAFMDHLHGEDSWKVQHIPMIKDFK